MISIKELAIIGIHRVKLTLINDNKIDPKSRDYFFDIVIQDSLVKTEE